jgi:hypothetical protein
MPNKGLDEILSSNHEIVDWRVFFLSQPGRRKGGNKQKKTNELSTCVICMQMIYLKRQKKNRSNVQEYKDYSF